MKYSVRVKLHSDVLKVAGDTITVGVKAKPEGGKANEELVRTIADHFHIPISHVSIISGWASRKKIIEIL